MIVTANGTRVWRRYRLVVACRDRLRLPPNVLAALEPRTRDHVLTTSGFFPAQLIVNTYMVTLLMVTNLPSGCVQLTMGHLP